ncbi:hypothetical protein C8R45DRAFT_1103739 [Mycena sanguinolenta]|nr:hypothetical protein C8R45DRAFT_1103739 [Mycena sanguinolenta]
MSSSLASTYGSWFISLFLETILYGIGLLQTFLYFQWWPNDNWSIQGPVLIVMFFETTQIVFFFRSSYYRFVQKFGIIQGDLIWSDSLQLLANYFTAFSVQLYFASRIYRLTKETVRMTDSGVSKWGVFVIVFLAVVQMSAGLAQTIWTHALTKVPAPELTPFDPQAITSLQTAASLACDLAITGFLCSFLQQNKHGLPRVLNTLMMNSVNRGMLTAGTSLITMALFLLYPDEFWFFLSLAPNSKFYMNSMLATLNMRQHFRDKVLGDEWNTINIGEIPGEDGEHTVRRARPIVSAVEFVRPHQPDQPLPDSTAVECPSSDSIASECTETALKTPELKAIPD